MPEDTATRWQFSLRTALITTTALAIALTVCHILGLEQTPQVLFIVASFLVPILLRGRRRRFYLRAFAVVYGPFVAMATYTYFFVNCTHCKAATWELLPFGPGVIPMILICRWLDLSIPHERWLLLLGLVWGVGLITVLTWLVAELGLWSRVITSLITLAFTSFAAYGLLAVLRA